MRLFALILLCSLSLTAQPEGGAAKAEGGKDEGKSQEKWDVNNPPGPRKEVLLDTSSGTWMSLSVSPDGKEIVFDLLGDIYSIPLTGGEAKALTSGIAWDMQPVFSPDGKSIAFTSDRAGGDNLWVMDRDGSNPRQVSKESFTLLNSPAWTPDSQFLAGRKHFTSRRSLGTGEIWLYHRSGGGGLQMTTKPNDQKDVGEPAFSPDGRYLYYSQDSTPGGEFEYNKDPNTEIYTILRLDRQTGDVETFVDGPGGSIRPTPSPDGKYLAFIRRVRYVSVLYLKRMDSGEEFPIYEGLDRDMQETWAIHGVYPSMAWTPDSQQLVFWAGGGIHRIEIETRQVREIPFTVKGNRTVSEAVRFPVQVAPEQFPVRMLRWAQVAPDGKSVVYQALGHLYIRPLPEGEPRRLTTRTDHFELYPSFSRDGQSIVYTTWDDAALGSIRVVPVTGGEGRTLTRQPRHYHEPVFSPSGDTIVFRKGSGGGIRSPLWSQDTGLYRIAAAGGDPVRIGKSGREPHFGRSEDRVYFLDSQDRKTVLKSVALTGADVRTHLTAAEAQLIRIAPNERWVAFQELHNAYVAPFVPTGRPVEIGASVSSIPVRKVSRDAGMYLHFSDDSGALHWTLGPELFTLPLTQAFAFLEGAPENLPDPPAEGRAIGFTAPYSAPTGAVAFTGARIITMRGDEVIPEGTVVMQGNRIRTVGPAASVSVPAGARVFDVKGATIVPGFLDVHAHGPYASDNIVPQRNWSHYATLAFGITTVHDPSSETSTVFAASELAKAGGIVAPRIFSTGTILYGAKTPFRAEVNSLEDARSHLRRMKAVGAFSVKSYNQPRRDQRQQIIAAARELEMMVVPEGGSLYHHNMSMIADGHTGIEHSVPVARLYGDVLQFWPKTGTAYTPTLVVAYGGLFGEEYWYQHRDVWANQRLLEFVPRFVIDPRARRRQMAPEEEYNHFNIAREAARLQDLGVAVQLGAHGQMQGIGPHWELWMFVQGGMTPLEALRTATLDGARYLGLDGDLGSLEPGKLADLVVLDRNPLADIQNSESVRYTVVNGVVFESRTMKQVYPEEKPRGRFFWEEAGRR